MYAGGSVSLSALNMLRNDHKSSMSVNFRGTDTFEQTGELENTDLVNSRDSLCLANLQSPASSLCYVRDRLGSRAKHFTLLH